VTWGSRCGRRAVAARVSRLPVGSASEAITGGPRTDGTPTTVWAVVFSNYEPAEVRHLFTTRAAAEDYVNAHAGDLRVEEWPVWRTVQEADA